MTTQQVADRYAELSKTNDYNTMYNELFSSEAKNIEPAHATNMQSVEGIEAIKQKGEVFNSMVEEMYGGYTTDPVVAGNFFTVAMGMEVKFKGMERSKMDEIVMYEVKDGKIVKEQFFY